ncbi:MAG: molybdopterin-guanine dinucleotide biosynthesis protein B, partial [Acidobacteria bacterium]|nr:molybdopterin-guanine dinucleotide biosynthesis protein B [Acidobacteriota bacterium]
MKMTFLEREPVLAVCGWSGSGKTTALESVIPLLVERGLRVAVVKHDAHGIDVDREGKDSARFFTAGADVHLHAPEEQMWRLRRRPEDSLEQTISSLLGTHDLVLIEGHKETPLPKIWCHSEG